MGRWLAEGGYDKIAERLFNELRCDRLLLEYDSPRAGDFAPLRFVPKDKIVVLGLITTNDGKTGSRGRRQCGGSMVPRGYLLGRRATAPAPHTAMRLCVIGPGKSADRGATVAQTRVGFRRRRDCLETLK